MKKSILSATLLLTMTLSTCAFADALDDAVAKYGPVCSQLDLAIFTDKRYQETSGGEDAARVYFDNKTIQIDKKNKTIDVWVSYIFNTSGRENAIHTLGDKYKNFGFTTMLKRISYTTNNIALKAIKYYNCDSTTISSYSNINDQAQSINPGSLNEILMREIMKKYDLK